MATSSGPKYTNREVRIIAENVKQHKTILFGSFTSQITHEVKESTWNSIVATVNSSNGANGAIRTKKQIKKKWQEFSRRSKVKAAKVRKAQNTTGNKKLKNILSLSELEENVVDIIGETAINGLEEGIDGMDQARGIRLEMGSSDIVEVNNEDMTEGGEFNRDENMEDNTLNETETNVEQMAEQTNNIPETPQRIKQKEDHQHKRRKEAH